MYVTREMILRDILQTGLDAFDIEDVEMLVNVMLQTFSALETQAWLMLYDSELDGTPLVLVEQGRIREVIARARKLVADVSACN
jgi:hypothetical protein